jgi:hypothetical protein
MSNPAESLLILRLGIHYRHNGDCCCLHSVPFDEGEHKRVVELDCSHIVLGIGR